MYYLTLGHSPVLSTLELSALGLEPRPLTLELVATKTDPTSIADKLGGTTRILESIQSTDKEHFISDLTKILSQESAKNVAITNYSSLNIEGKELKQIKSILSRPIRFMSFATKGHSLVALRKQHAAEYSIITDAEELVIAKTRWIQDADAWAKRDRKRPYQDIKRGMLPPKLARIMVNLATEGKQGTLLDPFCGTGTILMEALLLGNAVVGSDHDQAAVKGTEDNLRWLSQEFTLKDPLFQLYALEATHIGEKLAHTDFVVTEPYLGPLLEVDSLPPINKLKNIAKGLDKLYRGSLRAFHDLLPAHGRVAIVIPEFDAYNQVIPTLTVDSILDLGYNIESQTSYSQQNAVVTRQITVLTKQ